MNVHRSLMARTAASISALALVMGTSVAAAWAQETPAPTPAPEATTTEAEPPEEIHPLPEPKDNQYHAGQSLQIRVNADAEQNSDLINYRWSVNQVTVQAPESEDGTTVTVPMPERGSLPRYLNHAGFPSVDNGVSQMEAPIENGVGLSRSVSLWPQDEDPKVSLTAEFWLDGVKQESAQDVVGKDGVLTVQYTVSNLSTAPYDVTVPDLDGNPVTVTQEAQQLYVGIAKTLLPQRYAGLNTPGGMGGADGRANNQIQWIIVPTMPLNENGVKTFGWSARVTDAVIPSMLLQVQPVYHAPGHPEEEAEEAVAPEEGGSTVNLDPAVAQISAGIANIQTGLCSLTDCTVPETDEPTSCTVNGATSTDPLVCLDQTLGQVISFVVAGVSAPIQTALASVSSTLALFAGAGDLTQEEADARQAEFQALADEHPDGDLPPDGGYCAATFPVPPATNATAKAQCDASEIVYSELAAVPASQWMTGRDQLLAGIQQTLSGKLAAAGIPLQPGQTLQSWVDGLIVSLQNFSAPDLLPSTPEAQQQFLANGGQQVQDGIAQLSAGVGDAKTIIAAYLTEAAAELQAAAAAGKAELNTAVIHLRAEVAALKAAMATSPFPYGGNTEGIPEGTVLAGAYEFRVDAADTNHPYTLPRILIGLLALIAGGLVMKYLGDRNAVA